MESGQAFQVLYKDGVLRPVAAHLDLHDNESVWVRLVDGPYGELMPLAFPDLELELATIRARLFNLPSLGMDSQIASDRDRD